MFRKHDVRFIAVANGVDSDVQNSGEFAPFLNVMNEWYLRDCSRKIGAAYQVKGKSGRPTTNHPPYGYKKDPNNKDHWLIDEDAAAVVRRIFQLSIEGCGPYRIARILQEDCVECPSFHLGTHQSGRWKSQSPDSGRYNWYSNTVSTILSRQEYLGHTVNFRTYKKHYKDKTRIMHDPKDWLIFENTHEAIVDSETWKLAQQVRTTIRRTDTTGEANPLTGLVYCADCGAKMYNHRSHDKRCTGQRKPDIGLCASDYYNCSTYMLSYQNTETKCVSHYIGTRPLRKLVLESIKLVSTYAISNEAEFIERIRAASHIRQSEAAKDLKRKITKGQRRFHELDGLIKKLYESYATGKLTENRFELLSGEYEQEQAGLNRILADDQAALDAFAEDTAKVDQFLALAKRYTDFSELTTPMLHEFIERIVVHAPDYSSGERLQEVDIYFKFIGKFDVPLPAPSPEELEKEERRKRERIKNHEKYLRKKERARLAALSAAQEGAT